MSKIRGATIIGLSRSESKFQTILENKADHVVKLDKDWKEKVLEITYGKGVDVVYYSVGSILSQSIAVTKVRGSIVIFGMSGGNPDPVDPGTLYEGRKQLVGGNLWSFLDSSEERIKRSGELFKLIWNGVLLVKDPVTFKLEESVEAHRFLKSGLSQGKVILIP